MADDREQGMEFGDLADRLGEHDYPATTDEIVEAFGDETVGYSGGSETVASLLGPLSETYDSAEEVRQSIFNMVGEGAVGRKGYTDRGGAEHEREDETV